MDGRGMKAIVHQPARILQPVEVPGATLQPRGHGHRSPVARGNVEKRVRIAVSKSTAPSGRHRHPNRAAAPPDHHGVEARTPALTVTNGREPLRRQKDDGVVEKSLHTRGSRRRPPAGGPEFHSNRKPSLERRTFPSPGQSSLESRHRSHAERWCEGVPVRELAPSPTHANQRTTKDPVRLSIAQSHYPGQLRCVDEYRGQLLVRRRHRAGVRDPRRDHTKVDGDTDVTGASSAVADADSEFRREQCSRCGGRGARPGGHNHRERGADPSNHPACQQRAGACATHGNPRRTTELGLRRSVQLACRCPTSPTGLPRHMDWSCAPSSWALPSSPG